LALDLDAPAPVSASSAWRKRRFHLACSLGVTCSIFSRPPLRRAPVAPGIVTDRSAFSRFRFHPDPSTLALHNLLDQRRPMQYRGFLSLQTLEHAETPPASCGSMPSSVSRTANSHSPAFSRRDMDSGRFPAAILDRIGNEVLERASACASSAITVATNRGPVAHSAAMAAVGSTASWRERRRIDGGRSRPARAR